MVFVTPTQYLLAIIENCCAPMVVKCTLLATHLASSLLGASFNTIFSTSVMSLLLGASLNMNLFFYFYSNAGKCKF